MLSLATLAVATDISVLFMAGPHLSADLQPSSTQMLWIMDIYTFLVAGFLVTMGTLADRIGARRLLLVGGAGFAAFSVMAAYSVSAEMLLVARALQGISASTLTPSTMALIRKMFTDEKQRASAIAIWSICFMGGTAMGPVVGGLLLEWFWWGAVFLANVPVIVLLLIAGPKLLPEHQGDGKRGRLDPISVALSLAAVLAVIFGAKEFAANGWGAMPLVVAAAGFAIGIMFVIRQRQMPDPFMDVSLFRIPSFSAACGINLAGGALMGGFYLFVTPYVQLVADVTPTKAGLWLAPPWVGMVIASMVVTTLAHRYGYGKVAGVLLTISAIGAGLLMTVDASGGLTLVLVGFTLIGIGAIPSGILALDLIVGTAPPEKGGSAGAIAETAGELGLALGIASFGAIGTAIYRRRIGDAIPDGIPPEALEIARDTLAGAAVVAEELPEELRIALLGGAFDAFVHGFRVVSIVGVGLAVIFAVIALAFFRRSTTPKPGEPSLAGS